MYFFLTLKLMIAGMPPMPLYTVAGAPMSLEDCRAKIAALSWDGDPHGPQRAACMTNEQMDKLLFGPEGR